MLNMVDHLRRDSAYGQAIADDDELADLAVVGEGDSAPAVSEWSPEVEVLVAMYDRLGDVINAVSVTSGGKPVKVRPWPRPFTAADRARLRRKQDAYNDTMRKLFPEPEEVT